jgi:hypothetical protein
MGTEFDKDLCNEKHSAINRRLNNVEINFSDLIRTINGKFTKVFFMFVGVLLSIIGSLVIMIVAK